MKHSFRLSLLLASIFLSSCVVIQPYIQPAGEDVSTITFRSTDGGINLNVQYLPEEMDGCNCTSRQVQLIGIIHNKSIGMGKYADGGKDLDSFSIKATPDKPFRFAIALPYIKVNSYIFPSTTIDYCQAHQEFLPQAGRKYEVVYDVKVHSCALSLFDLTDGARNEVSIKSLPMCVEYPTMNGWVEKGIREFCHNNPKLYLQK